MTTKDSGTIQTPLDYLADWSDGMRCWQSVYQMQSQPIISAASARKTGLQRAAALIARARKNSPLYARYYASVPEGSALEAYPPISRSTLMENFDDWAIDRRIDKTCGGTTGRFFAH